MQLEVLLQQTAFTFFGGGVEDLQVQYTTYNISHQHFWVTND